MNMNRNRLWSTIGATVVTVLALTGCSAGTTGGGSTPSTAATIDSTIGTTFSGGTAGKADSSKTPITVGLINQEGGTISDPEVSAAIQAAFDYINASQSGINGHPLKLDLCKITSSDEEAQQCAQQFLNDNDVQVVLQGGLNVGTQSVHQTLNGAKPDVVTLANFGTDQTAKNTFAVNPSAIAALPGFANYAKAEKYKTFSVVAASDATDLQIAQVAKQLYAQIAGGTAKVVSFPVGSTDLTSTYTAANATKPDAITPIAVTTSACSATAAALQQIGSTTPVIASGLCATDDLKKSLGDFPKWAYEATTLSLYAPDSSGQLAFYKAVMAKYAGANAQLGIGAPAAFGAAFLVAKALNTVGGDAPAASKISSALKAYDGGILLGTPKVAFGSVKDSPTLSGVADRFYVYKGNGKWSSTDWQSVPE